VGAILERFGATLRRLRTERGLSQEKLAELSGLHWTYVSSVERGQRNISLENITYLAKALGVTPADLLSAFTKTKRRRAR
jgi:transcriptional regulator with XRE-family HTH domain